MPERSPSPEAPPAPKEYQQEETNPDLAKYLNRSYWEQRKVNESPLASPSAPSPMPTPQPQAEPAPTQPKVFIFYIIYNIISHLFMQESVY